MTLINESAETDNSTDSHLLLITNMETTTVKFYPLVKSKAYLLFIFTIAYTFVFVLSLIGNTLVILVVFRNKRMQTVTNFFIVNLAIADILVTIFCLPINLVTNILTGWRLGLIMCKIVPFLQGTSVSASVNTLVAIAIDRYIAICHHWKLHMTRTVARLITLLIWLWSITIMIPWLMFFKVEYFVTSRQTIPHCVERWPDYNGNVSDYTSYMKRSFYLGVTFLSCYTLPLILIAICYAFLALRVWRRNAPGVANTSEVVVRSKVKVLKMLSIVVGLFAVSWLPVHANRLRFLYGETNSMSDLEKNFFGIFIPVAQWLAMTNSCVNPIIYCFFSKKFRRAFQQLTFERCKKKKKTTTISNSCNNSNNRNSNNNNNSQQQSRLAGGAGNNFPSPRILQTNTALPNNNSRCNNTGVGPTTSGGGGKNTNTTYYELKNLNMKKINMKKIIKKNKKKNVDHRHHHHHKMEFSMLNRQSNTDNTVLENSQLLLPNNTALVDVEFLCEEQSSQPEQQQQQPPDQNDEVGNKSTKL